MFSCHVDFKGSKLSDVEPKRGPHETSSKFHFLVLMVGQEIVFASNGDTSNATHILFDRILSLASLLSRIQPCASDV